MIHRHTVLAMVLLILTGTLWAQERQFQHNPLRGLQGALESADATALTPDQEEQLRALLTEFRESRGADGSRTALGESRQAFQDAILSSDPAVAQLQADIIANQILTSTVTSLENQASLKIQFLNILTQAQVDAVLERTGASGLFRLLGSPEPGNRQGRRPSGRSRR